LRQKVLMVFAAIEKLRELLLIVTLQLLKKVLDT